MLSAREELGMQVWLAWQTLWTEELNAVLIVIGLMGLILNAVLDVLTRTGVSWQGRKPE